MLWTVSTFMMKAYIAASCHCVRSSDVAGRIDPRLALTENRCHCHTLLFFRCSDDSLSLVNIICFAVSFALRSAAIARLVFDASLLHCTPERPTLLNFAVRPSLLTWLCTSLSAGFASVWWSFLALVLSLKLVCCRLEIWRLRGWLLEVCIIASGD